MANRSVYLVKVLENVIGVVEQVNVSAVMVRGVIMTRNAPCAMALASAIHVQVTENVCGVMAVGLYPVARIVFDNNNLDLAGPR